jgi:RNA polymerase-binding protein DksA
VPPKTKTKTASSAAAKTKRVSVKAAAGATKRSATTAAASGRAAKTATKAAPPARPVKPLPKKYERVRQMLIEEAARIRADLKEVESRTARTSESEVASETGGTEDHPADMASETYEREKDLALSENLTDILGKIRIALEKMEQGTYGICDACRQRIAAERLEALPFATLCVSCQSHLEGR